MMEYGLAFFCLQKRQHVPFIALDVSRRPLLAKRPHRQCTAMDPVASSQLSIQQRSPGHPLHMPQIVEQGIYWLHVVRTRKEFVLHI